MSKIDNGHWLCFVAGCLCGCAVEMSSASACHYSPLGWCVRRPKIKFGHATHAIWLHNADKAKHTQNTAPFMPVARFSCVTKRSVSASFISSVPVCRHVCEVLVGCCIYVSVWCHKEFLKHLRKVLSSIASSERAAAAAAQIRQDTWTVSETHINIA